jgi:hypothetical protein
LPLIWQATRLFLRPAQRDGSGILQFCKAVYGRALVFRKEKVKMLLQQIVSKSTLHRRHHISRVA